MSAFTASVALSVHRHVKHICPQVTVRGVQTPSRRAARMVLSDKETQRSSTPIRITGNNVTLTDSLQGYIRDKLSKVTSRFGSVLTKMDVHLTVEHNPSIHNNNKAEVVAFAGKTILRTEVRSDDMYSAIDAVEERIGRTIRKFKERREAKTKTSKLRDPSQVDESSTRASSPIADVSDAKDGDEQYKDVYQTKEAVPGVPAVTEVVKRKVFPMPLQTVEEAVLCCEYVDHPWYLFRNAETKEICLVYKRNHGGYGLIEPSNPDGKDEEPVL